LTIVSRVFSAFSSLDECFKASAYAWEALSDPQSAKSTDNLDTPFGKAFRTKNSLWDLYAQEPFRQRRFNTAMHGITALQPQDIPLAGEDTSSPL
jgi:hypothetical protein